MFQNAKLVFSLIFALGALPLWSATIPVGTKLVIRLDQNVEPADKNHPRFTAQVDSPVFVDGRQIIPVGMRIEGEVRGSKKSIFLSPKTLILPDGSKVDFYATVEGISAKNLKAQEKEGTIEQKGGDRGAAAQQAGEVGSMGAIIGAVSTGSLEGAAIGAAAGVGAVLIGRKIAGSSHPIGIPAGTRLDLSLNKAIEVPDSVGNIEPAEIKTADREDQRPILTRQDAQETVSETAPQTAPESAPETH